MCGLTGFWHFTKPNNKQAMQTLAAMTAAIEHRGPDSHGHWLHPKHGLGLGHRRLAIVDLSQHGHQPMWSQSGQSTLIYNGEIYNANTLRKQLAQTFKLKFKGHSDTEVLLEALEHWGVEKTLKATNGMFALAFWSEANQTLTLARDRIGIKPLYWGVQNGTLLFGSQLKSLRKHLSWQGNLNPEALQAYFQLGYIPSPMSIFQNIHKCTPGHFITIASQERIEPKCYWSPHDLPQQATLKEQRPEQHVKALDTLLTEAVGARMIADVPLGAFLSGGIDSSTVTALMQKQSTQKVKTFSIGFDIPKYNEAQHAKAVAEHLKTDHHEWIVSAKDAINLIPKLPEWFDEPLADPSQIPTALVCKMAREQVTVALSGDGGDELFAGYSRYAMGAKIHGYTHWMPYTLRQGLAKKLLSLSSSKWQGAKMQKIQRLAQILASKDFSAQYLSLISSWQQPQNILAQPTAPFQLPQHPDKLSATEIMQWIDTVTYLPDDILCKVDRASMAFGLEARVPLLDHRVIECAWQLPENIKIRQGKCKWVLKQVLKKYLPETMVERPKMGFGIPLDHWLKGALKDWGQSLVQNSKHGEWFHMKHAEHLWDQYQTNDQQYHRQLWTLLVLLAWLEHWDKTS